MTRPFRQLLLALGIGLALAACSRPAAPEVSRQETPRAEALAFTVSITPSPIDRAMSRYSDFSYHIRPVGAPEYTTFPAAKVEPTKDRSVLATFDVVLPAVKVDELYESYVAYKLDGREEISRHPTEALCGGMVDGRIPGSTPCP